MNKNLKWLSLGGVITALLFAMNVPAVDSGFNINDIKQTHLYDDLVKACMNTAKKDCQSWALSGGGSEAPRGLTSDSKAELAVGERYILSGTIYVIDRLPYLRISFADHPWLASRVRVNDPYYRIRDGEVNWKRYRGREVTMVGTARYSIWSDEEGRPAIEVLIEPVADAIIEALQR